MKSKFAALSIIVFSVIGNASELMSLQEAYSLALQYEPKLKSAYFKTEANGESIEQVRSRLFPQISSTVSAGRYEYEYQSSDKATKENYTDYSISAVQPLYRPEYWLGLDQAKTKYQSALEQLKAQKQQVGLDVAKAYFSVLHSEKSIELAKAQKLYYEQKYKQLEEMLKIGLTNKIDLLETKIARDKARSQLAIEQKRGGVAKLRLENMIGTHVNSLHPFDFEMIDASRWKIDKKEFIDKLVKNPLYKSAQLNVQIARDEIEIRNYEHYPKIDLSLTRKETNSADLVTHKYDNQAIVRMNIPIYSGGYVQSRVKEGNYLLDAAQQERDYYQFEAKSKLEEAWEESQYSIENYNNLKDSEKSAQLFVESVEKAYAAGLKSIVDVLEAKAKLYEIKRDLIDAGYQLVNNRLLLLDVTGELDAESIERFQKELIAG